jgi:sulfatase modifying factor 1
MSHAMTTYSPAVVRVDATHLVPFEDMVWIPGGEFQMGSNSHYPEEGPVHRVHVDGFWMDRFPVTNERFGRFVEATRHLTYAEIAPRVEDYPGTRPDVMHAGSLVFEQPTGSVDLRVPTWWRFVRGASWRHPLGPTSHVHNLQQHPAVHIAYSDAAVFATWEGKSLPTEAEWEFAARGGLEGAMYAWGDELAPHGTPMANFWQGDFPRSNTMDDGWLRTSPVGSFAGNGYGLYDMIGNVWEWTTDWFRPRHPSDSLNESWVARNPRCEHPGESYDPREVGSHVPRKVLKGGSHLCAPNYCRRYRPAARYPEPIDTSACHVGFRCIVRPSELQFDN